jgi:threonine dehydrogenase-like Zn-dependent dehydrogenase
VGRHEDKLAILRRRGIATHLESEPIDFKADLVVDCTGQPSGFERARQLVRPRGTLVIKSTFAGAAEIALTPLVVDEVTLVGSRCGPFAPALRLLERGLIDVTLLITATYPLSDGLAAMQRAAAQGTLKVLLRP